MRVNSGLRKFHSIYVLLCTKKVFIRVITILTFSDIETGSAVQTLSRMLHIKAARISFAGFKDKRGITVQKMTVYKLKATDVPKLINSANNS